MLVIHNIQSKLKCALHIVRLTGGMADAPDPSYWKPISGSNPSNKSPGSCQDLSDIAVDVRFTPSVGFLTLFSLKKLPRPSLVDCVVVSNLIGISCEVVLFLDILSWLKPPGLHFFAVTPWIRSSFCRIHCCWVFLFLEPLGLPSRFGLLYRHVWLDCAHPVQGSPPEHFIFIPWLSLTLTFHLRECSEVLIKRR